MVHTKTIQHDSNHKRPENEKKKDINPENRNAIFISGFISEASFLFSWSFVG